MLKIKLIEPLAEVLRSGGIRAVYLHKQPESVNGYVLIQSVKPSKDVVLPLAVRQEFTNQVLFGNIKELPIPNNAITCFAEVKSCTKCIDGFVIPGNPIYKLTFSNVIRLLLPVQFTNDIDLLVTELALTPKVYADTNQPVLIDDWLFMPANEEVFFSLKENNIIYYEATQSLSNLFFDEYGCFKLPSGISYRFRKSTRVFTIQEDSRIVLHKHSLFDSEYPTKTAQFRIELHLGREILTSLCTKSTE